MAALNTYDELLAGPITAERFIGSEHILQVVSVLQRAVPLSQMVGTCLVESVVQQGENSLIESLCFLCSS